MNNTPTLATPFAVRWRDFRHGILPYVVFAGVLGCAVVLWDHRLGRSALVGQAEAVHSVVTATKPGVVVALKADLLQPVKRGEVVAQIVPADLEAVCAGLTASVEALRAQMLQGADRNTVNYQQLRLDWLRRNVELASARIERQLAETEFQRFSLLHENRTISDADFDARRTNRDALDSKVSLLEQLTADLQVQIARLQPADKSGENPADRAISAAILSQQKQLEALADAANLRAPMDGIVTAIQKRPGENAAAGDPVLVVGALRPTRIVAWLRQPLGPAPKPGDFVAVTSRNAGHSAARARVLQVGTQLEAIEPTVLPVSAASQRTTEYGLPLLIEIPAGLQLAPGEIVSIAATMAG